MRRWRMVSRSSRADGGVVLLGNSTHSCRIRLPLRRRLRRARERCGQDPIEALMASPLHPVGYFSRRAGSPGLACRRARESRSGRRRLRSRTPGSARFHPPSSSRTGSANPPAVAAGRFQALAAVGLPLRGAFIHKSSWWPFASFEMWPGPASWGSGIPAPTAASHDVSAVRHRTGRGQGDAKTRSEQADTHSHLL